MFRYYIIAIVVGNILIGLVNGLVGLPGYSTPVALLVCLGVSVLFTALEFGLDAVIAWLTRLLPEKAVDPFRKLYRVAKWEKKLYKKLQNGTKKQLCIVVKTVAQISAFQTLKFRLFALTAQQRILLNGKTLRA